LWEDRYWGFHTLTCIKHKGREEKREKSIIERQRQEHRCELYNIHMQCKHPQPIKTGKHKFPVSI
jgi:hypothetical protein